MAWAPPHRVPMAVCGSCDARYGERIRSRERSRTGVARVCGDVGSVAGWPSGREWNGSQPGQGASELGFPRPAPGEMQSEAARRAGDRPAGRRTGSLVVTVRSPRPSAPSSGRGYAPSWTASQAPRRHQTDAVLEVAYGARSRRDDRSCPIRTYLARGRAGNRASVHPPDNEPLLGLNESSRQHRRRLHPVGNSPPPRLDSVPQARVLATVISISRQAETTVWP